MGGRGYSSSRSCEVNPAAGRLQGPLPCGGWSAGMNDHQSGAVKALAAAALAAGDVSPRARKSRAAFLHQYADAIYDALTDNRSRFVRIGELVIEAARQFPGLVPTEKDIAAEEGLLQSRKAG